METTSTGISRTEDKVGGWGWMLLGLDCLAFWAVTIAGLVVYLFE